MRQILHGSATTTEAIYRTIQKALVHQVWVLTDHITEFGAELGA